MFLEGETISLIDAHKILALDVAQFFEGKENTSLTVEIVVNLDENYVFHVECTCRDQKISKMLKYIPVKQMSKRHSMRMLN